ncbi:hypothetical protein [uncultured Desulfobacter sp.]|uniref:hypothetical protein n=1 Tax=uncultured Desulfobacter sp. TaxID=240139 RepID=UPI002AA690DD|nr:hypothetical protein [uncultured Desulfobacter sp.]
MPRYAQVFRVLVASPSDLSKQRDEAFKAIQDWNKSKGLNNTVLEAVGWEFDVYPDISIEGGQHIINKQIVDSSDIVIAMFWTKLGTPTNSSQSGTIEEIDRAVKLGKKVMVYFSNENPTYESIIPEEFERLKEYQKKCFGLGIMGAFSTAGELHKKILKDLELRIVELKSNNNLKFESLVYTFQNNINSARAAISRYTFDLDIDNNDDVEFRCVTFEPNSNGKLSTDEDLWQEVIDFRIDNHKKIDRRTISEQMKKEYHSFKFYLKVKEEMRLKYYARLLSADAVVTGEGDLRLNNGYRRIWFVHSEGFIHPLFSKPYLANQAMAELSIFQGS